MKWIRFFRFDVTSPLESRVFLVDYLVSVDWFWQVHTREDDFSSISGGITDVTASLPFSKFSSEGHRAASSDNSRVEDDEILSFEHQLIIFVIVEYLQFDFARVSFRNEMKITKP